MKKIIVALFVLAGVHANAQKNTISIKAGFGLTNVKRVGTKPSSQFKLTGGLQATVTAIKLKDELSVILLPEIMYQPNGYDNYPLTVNVNYLNVSMPVCLNFFSDDNDNYVGLFFGAGPFFGYGLSGKFQQANGPDIDVKFGDGVNDNRTQFNSGIVFKAGLKFHKLGLILEQFTGLKNLIPKDRIVGNEKLTSRGFYMTMTVDLK